MTSQHTHTHNDDVPDCMSRTAAKSAISVLSRWSFESPMANSKMGSTKSPSPPVFNWDLLSTSPLCNVRVCCSGLYRQAARKHMISMQHDFSNKIWSSTFSCKRKERWFSHTSKWKFVGYIKIWYLYYSNNVAIKTEQTTMKPVYNDHLMG